MQKKFCLLTIFLFIIFLNGCTQTSICGDRICSSGEYCQVDCYNLEYNNSNDNNINSNNLEKNVETDFILTEESVIEDSLKTPNSENNDSIENLKKIVKENKNTKSSTSTKTITPPEPTNSNVLCVYNKNTQLSKDICDYYLQKRPGVSLLGLDIPTDKFFRYNTYSNLLHTVPGFIENTYNFNGSGYWIPKVNTDSITISVWLNRRTKATGNAPYNAVFGGWKWGGNEAEDIQKQEGYEIRFVNDRLTFSATTKDSSNKKSFKVIYYDFPQDHLNKWYNIIATYDSTSGKQELYVNGEKVATGIHPSGNTLVTLTDPNWTRNYFGYSITNNSHFLGLLDEAIILNRALNFSEAKNLYEKNLAKEKVFFSSNEQIGYWGFEENLEIPTITYEDMRINDFENYVVKPIDEWVNNSGKNITHLAMAKDLPIRIYDKGKVITYGVGVSVNDYFSASFILSHPTKEALNFYDINIGHLHFDKQNYIDTNGELKLKYAVSHLTAYTFDDIKMMIDKANRELPSNHNIILDADSDDKSLSKSQILDTEKFLMVQGINLDNIIKNYNNNKPLESNLPVSSYYGSGVYHSDYGGGVWIVNPGNFNFEVTNKAIISSLESYNATTFIGSTEHQANMIFYGQGKLADAFSPIAFGGTNYSRSFSGGAGHVSEPYINSAFSQIFLPAYYSGLTLGESGSLNPHPSYITVGDPLMQLYPLKKRPLDALCEVDSECLSNNCNFDSVGVKRCRRLGKNDCFIGKFPERGYFNLEIKNGNYFLVLPIEPNKFNIKKCINGELVDWDIGLDPQNYACTYTNIYTIDQNILCGLKTGALCEKDSECLEESICIIDIEGKKRCASSNPGCTINQNSGVIDTRGFCINENQKKICNGKVWSAAINCEKGCRNGFCVGEYYDEETKTFKLKKGIMYGLTLPVQPDSNKTSEIFTEMVPLTSLSVWTSNTWGNSTYNKHPTNPIYMFRPDRNLIVGQGFLIKSPEDINFIIKGNKINSLTINFKGKYSIIGLPNVPKGFKFSDLIKKLNTIDSSCKTVSLPNLDGGIQEWWSIDTNVNYNGRKVDLEILPYELLIVTCNENTNFNWVTNYDEEVSYSWITGNWSNCSGGNCLGGGVKTRTVVCKTNSGETVSDSFCTETRPETSTPCTSIVCDNNSICNSGVCTKICTQNNWAYTDGNCTQGNYFTRTWQKIGICINGTPKPNDTNETCIYGEIDDESSIVYTSDFNNTSELALKIDNQINPNKKITGEKEVNILDKNKIRITFEHDFSEKKLDLTNFKLKNGLIDEKKFVLVKNLDVNTKKVILPRTNNNNFICILDEETNDENIGKNNCKNILCPTTGKISCTLSVDSYIISGLKHSFVMEAESICGDNYCASGETCQTCKKDCGECEICENDLDCGINGFVGEKFCENNKVVQKYVKYSCETEKTSFCSRLDSNQLIEDCLDKNCIKGACGIIADKNENYCSNANDCKDNETCVNTKCNFIECKTGFTTKNHSCVCDGNICGENCYNTTGVCCENNWVEEETCEKLNTEDDSISVFDIGIIIGAIVFILILIFLAISFINKN